MRMENCATKASGAVLMLKYYTTEKEEEKW